MSCRQSCLECGTGHGVRGSAVADTLLIVNCQNRRQQRIIFAQDQRMIEILQYFPGGFFDLVS